MHLLRDRPLVIELHRICTKSEQQHIELDIAFSKKAPAVLGFEVNWEQLQKADKMLFRLLADKTVNSIRRGHDGKPPCYRFPPEVMNSPKSHSVQPGDTSFQL